MKVFKICCCFLFIFFNMKANEINTNFNSIFSNTQTEEGKKSYIPTYQGTNVVETEVNHNNIDNIAQENLLKNESAKFINESFNSREYYDTNQLGNIIVNTQNTTDNAENVVNKNYCEKNKIIEYKTCYDYKGTNLCNNNIYSKSCNSNLFMQCTKYKSGCATAGLELSTLPNDIAWNYNNGVLIIGQKSGNNYWVGTCLVIDRIIEFNVSNLELVEFFSLNRMFFDDYMLVALNDNIIHVGPDNGTKLEVINNRVHDGVGVKVCERSTIWNQYINKDITKFLKLGKNQLRIKVVVSGSGQGSAEFLLKNKCCEELVEKWEEKCNSNFSEKDKCFLESKICLKKDHTIIFEGKNIFKKCAEYKQNYNCQNNQNSCFSHDNDCSKFDLSQCSLEKKELIDKDQMLTKFLYKCSFETNNENLCNQEIKCLDGNCQDLEKTNDNLKDMLEVISLLSTLNESIKTIDSKDLTILNGENLKCKEYTNDALIAGTIVSGGMLANLLVIDSDGMKGCCRVKDSNGMLSQFSCDQKEDKLREKRKNQDCLYIGKYCNEKINFGLAKLCISEKRSFCCFDNKFSKIIANATRQQGLQNWGSSENTNCQGILLENFDKIDFTKIDFTELYEDIKGSVSEKDLLEKIKQTTDRLKNEF